MQRDSNTYAVLSIRTKLNLIGFDIAKKDEKGEDASEEFMKKYQKDDEIVYLDEEFKGKKMVDYGESNFKEGTLRHTLTVLEHDRWNAYEICSGVIPATKEEIMTQDKAYLLKKRKHGNITTFDGLKRFREMKGYDVIKYDYQLLDDAVWLLHKYGYKIVKKK